MVAKTDSDGRSICELFMRKPSAKVYPEYYVVIKQPIDLREIYQKIRNNQYPNMEELMASIDLMITNACTFNEEGSQVYNDALTLKEAAEDAYKQLQQGWQPHPLSKVTKGPGRPRGSTSTPLASSPGVTLEAGGSSGVVAVEKSPMMQLFETVKGCNGYFSMAKARYAMGHHAVGALQYDAVMTPLVHVETSDQFSSFDETDSNLEFRIERLQLGRKQSPEGTDSSGTELRRRRPGSGGQSSVEDVPVRGGESESVREVKDPLKWFGILVPQSLRHSQQYFIQAISHSPELATIQMKVELLRRRYSKLLVDKRGLKSQKAC